MVCKEEPIASLPEKATDFSLTMYLGWEPFSLQGQLYSSQSSLAWKATISSGSSMATPPARSSLSAAFSASPTTTPPPLDFHRNLTMFLSRITAAALASFGAA